MATLPRLQAARVLRPGGRGRADPARPDPGRLGAPVHPPPQRPGAGHLPAPAAARRRWSKTLGVPLFQEQLMQMAIDVAGFTAGRGRPAAPGDGLQARRRADGARCASGSTTGMAAQRHHRRGRRRDLREDRRPSPTTASPRATRSASPTWSTPARGSSCYYPAAFCAALLNAQPMGFYSPQTLVADARRHGVEVARPGRQRRRAEAILSTASGPQRRAGAGASGSGLAERAHDRRTSWPSGSTPSATPARPFRDLADLVRRVRLTVGAARGAGHRGGVRLLRASTGGEALWAAGAVAPVPRGAAAGHGRRRWRRPRCRG